MANKNTRKVARKLQGASKYEDIQALERENPQVYDRACARLARQNKPKLKSELP